MSTLELTSFRIFKSLFLLGFYCDLVAALVTSSLLQLSDTHTMPKNASAWQESRTLALSTPPNKRTLRQRLQADAASTENRRLLGRMLTENEISRKARTQYLGFERPPKGASLTLDARVAETKRVNRENKYMVERLQSASATLDTGSRLSRSGSRQASRRAGSPAQRGRNRGSRQGSRQGSQPTSFTQRWARGGGDPSVQLPAELLGGAQQEWFPLEQEPLRPGSSHMLRALTARSAAYSGRAYLSDSDSDDGGGGGGGAATRRVIVDPFKEESKRRDVMASKARSRQRAIAFRKRLDSARLKASMPEVGGMSRFAALQNMSNGSGSSHFKGFPPNLQSSGIGGVVKMMKADDLMLEEQMKTRLGDDDDFEDALDRADEDPDAGTSTEASSFLEVIEDARAKGYEFPIPVRKVLLGRVKPAKGTMMVMSRRNTTHMLHAMRLQILQVRIQVRGASTLLRSATRRRVAQIPENKRKEYDAEREAERAKRYVPHMSTLFKKKKLVCSSLSRSLCLIIF